MELTGQRPGRTSPPPSPPGAHIRGAGQVGSGHQSPPATSPHEQRKGQRELGDRPAGRTRTGSAGRWPRGAAWPGAAPSVSMVYDAGQSPAKASATSAAGRVPPGPRNRAVPRVGPDVEPQPRAVTPLGGRFDELPAADDVASRGRQRVRRVLDERTRGQVRAHGTRLAHLDELAVAVVRRCRWPREACRVPPGHQASHRFGTSPAATCPPLERCRTRFRSSVRPGAG